MRKAISVVTSFTILLFVASSIAADKVVVVPLNSNSASGVDGQVQYNDGGREAASEIYYSKTTGNVGIGTATPAARLDVVATDPALPALRVAGDMGLELVGTDGGDDGIIHSRRDNAQSDLFMHSNDEFWIYLDSDNNSTGYFIIYAGDGAEACRIEEDGDLVCAGNKSAVVEVGDDLRRMYAIESSEIWFEDFGAGELSGGVATLSLDSLFAKTVDTNADYHVYLTPTNDCNGLYVKNKTSSGFEVRELGGGTSSAGFDYRIVAKRLGFADVRMEKMDRQQNTLEEGDGG